MGEERHRSPPFRTSSAGCSPSGKAPTAKPPPQAGRQPQDRNAHMPEDLLTLAAELRERGEAFALATVVRCERPTSAKPGAKALIRPDGRVTGWVGGACAEPVVAREALAALGDGQPRLVVLVGDGGRDPTRT